MGMNAVRFYMNYLTFKSDTNPQNAEGCFRLDFEKSLSGQTLYSRNKEYLEKEILYFIQFGIKNNVPMNVGEFGLYYDCFNNKGGLIWMEDVLDLLLKYNLNFTFHTYHEYSFGLYRNPSGLPDPNQVNDELIKLFTKKLK